MNLDYSLLYHPDYYESCLQENHFVAREMSYQKYEKAMILPWKRIDNQYGGGILTEQKEYLSNTGLHNGNGIAYEPDEVRYSDEKVIYLGMLIKTWGHCLTDNVRRLWFLNTKEYKEVFQDYKLVYTPFADFSFYENFRQLLSIWGLDPDTFVSVTEPTCYKEIIIPDESFFTTDEGAIRYTREYCAMIDQIRQYGEDHRTELEQTRYYFSYSGLSRSAGRERLEKFFAQHGYEIVYPEKLSFFEQLNIFVNVTDFASTIGSCSHNTMFLRDETNVLLIPRGNYLTGYQEAIDEIHPLNIRYVDSSMSVYLDDKEPWVGPFYFFVSKNLSKAYNRDSADQKNYPGLLGFWIYKQKCLTLRSINECKKAHQYYLDEYLNFLMMLHRRMITWRLKRTMLRVAKEVYHILKH